jgi:uncharacterized membrane protein YjjP (DUF1212 family)
MGEMQKKALATGVLYLIPGVPLVNGVIDFIEVMLQLVLPEVFKPVCVVMYCCRNGN